MWLNTSEFLTVRGLNFKICKFIKIASEEYKVTPNAYKKIESAFNTEYFQAF